MNPFTLYADAMKSYSRMWFDASVPRGMPSLDPTKAIIDAQSSAVAAHMGAASAMIAAATNPWDANFLRAWTGQDIFVR